MAEISYVRQQLFENCRKRIFEIITKNMRSPEIQCVESNRKQMYIKAAFDFMQRRKR